MSGDWLVTCSGRDHRLDVTLAADLDRASRDEADAVIAGTIDDADAVVSRAIESRRQLPEFLRPLRGRFALVLSDRATERVSAARDHVGLHPLFYAMTTSGDTVFSNSIPLILAQTGVASTLNRAVLAEHLLHRWVDPEETYHTAIRRVPPGHYVELTRGRSVLHRFWNPRERAAVPDEEALPRFTESLQRAVERVAGRRRTAIFLSGGFDSVSIASIASADARRRGARPPFALSLGFEDRDCDEQAVQIAVARRLGLEQALIPLRTAVGDRGVLAAALEVGEQWPVPLLNLWTPAYAHLVRAACPAECDVILTGTGGDEWLNVTPLLFADLLRGGRMRELVALMNVFRLSFSMSRARVFRNAVWTFGMRPLISQALDALAPRPWHRERHRKLIRAMPDWLAPDRALRQDLEQRAERLILPADPGPGGFYERELQQALVHPLVAIEYEEHFEFGRRMAVPLCHPYLDTDLVELLYAVPPRILTHGGRMKGLVREAVSAQFPGVGFETQKKVDATMFFRGLLQSEGATAWTRAHGARALGDLGIVDASQLSARMADLFAGRHPEDNHLIWTALNLETWARPRA